MQAKKQPAFFGLGQQWNCHENHCDQCRFRIHQSTHCRHHAAISAHARRSGAENMFASMGFVSNITPVKQALSCDLTRKVKRGYAATWLIVFLLLQAIVVLPGIHVLLHPDAKDPGHECAVTLFTHGQVHCPDAAVPVVRPEPMAIFSQSPSKAIFVSTDVPLLPGRGPPSPLSVLS